MNVQEIVSAGRMKLRSDNTPLVSVIIPVKNGGATLDACLRSIRRSYYKNIEVVVVDDHSTDETVEVARRHDCTVLEVADGHGANHARNFGARQAKGDIFVFIDSDIVVSRERVLGIIETLDEESIDAVVGIYTAKHRHESFVSQYKNLWIRYSYIKSPPAIDWLFGAISGIKRQAFERLGGFNVKLLARHGHDDIELGKRFARANLNIVLNMDIEVEHLKQYTMTSFIKNEFHRSAGFAELAVRFGEATQSMTQGFVNVYPGFILSVLFSVIVLAVLCASAVGWIPRWHAASMVGCYLLLNIRFLNYLEQVRGLFAMIVMIPFLFLDHLVCFVGSAVGLLKGLGGRKKNANNG
ncbi:MAG: glycosyltransferase family 2 protein [Ignavibacteriales bacterium]|nr:glycosyltransferase family 2 protein [Ignavibacteriales bacterium]